MTNKNEQRKVPELRFPEFSGEWKSGTLKSFGDFYYGKSAPKWSLVNTGGTPCVRYGELYTKYHGVIEKVDSHTSIDVSKLKLSKGGEVLIPRVGEKPKDFSKASVLTIPDIAIGEMISVYNTEQNPFFIMNYIRGKLTNEFAKRVEGGSVSNLYFTELENVTINVPEIREQQKIGEFFSKLDRQIELEEKKLALLEEQKKGYMQKIFSQELRFKDENAEEYPEWEEVVFSKLFKSKIEKNNDLEFDKNKIISVAKMQYKEDNNKDSSNEYMKTYNKMRLNDIAFEGNKSKDYRYGRFVLNDIGDGIVSHVFIVFSPIMDFESSFMKYYINYEPIMGRKLLFATTSTLMMTSLKTNEFMNLSIRLPGINEQRKIGLFISTFNKKIETQNMKVSLLINMKKQLLNKMMI